MGVATLSERRVPSWPRSTWALAPLMLYPLSIFRFARSWRTKDGVEPWRGDDDTTGASSAHFKDAPKEMIGWRHSRFVQFYLQCVYFKKNN